ncbi:MAG TPA: hypothetical protein VGJ15_07675 [Pirellulales bacterium]
MRFSIYCFGFFILLSSVLNRSLFGHGFELSLDGNKIVAESEVATPSPRLFIESLDPFSSTVMFTDHGGVEAADGGGLQLPGDTLALQFVSPLWYSAGATAVHASAGVTLTAQSFDTSTTPNPLLGTVALTGSSANPGSFPVTGDDDHSIGWILSGNSIPAGAYGFAYRAIGFKDGNPQSPFVASDPLVVVFNTPDFTSSGSLADAQTTIFQAIYGGDFNLDSQHTSADLDLMLVALTNADQYRAGMDLNDFEYNAIADLDRDGTVTNADMQNLISLLNGNPSGGSPQAVPEPDGKLLALLAGGLTCIGWWWRSKRG